MTDKNLEAKLGKLLTLSQRGIEGEKENAAEMLEKLLKKHDINIDDITEEIKTRHWFNYKGQRQGRLLHQIITATTNRGTSSWTMKGKGYKMGADVTKCEMLEIEMLFSAYKIALEDELDFALEAFVNKNYIFPDSEEAPRQDKLTLEEIQRAKLMAERMMSMQAVKVRKQISHS